MNCNFSHYIFSLLIMCLSVYALGAHKIIIQVSPPRCLSTASLRAWQARGDCEVMNEPFMSAFMFQDEGSREVTNKWLRADTPTSFKDVEQKIVQMSHKSMVFVKEISFALLAYLKRNTSLAQNPDVYFVFLIRNPANTVHSFYKKQHDDQLINNFSYYVGFETCYAAFQMISACCINKPIIVHAEDIYAQPRQTMEWLCKEIQIPFLETMLQWNNLGNEFTGIKEWYELKRAEHTYYWHGDAIKSTGFHTPNVVCELDSLGNPTYGEIANEKDRMICLEAYRHNKIYYDLLVQEKNKK